MNQDGIPITTLERAVSTDVVNAQELISRSVAEITSAMTRYMETSINSGQSAQYARTHVASGLSVNVILGGTSIGVSPGILMQSVPASPPQVPAQGTFDSYYRFGLLMSQEDVGDPWDTTSAWWLLEGRVVRNTTLSEVRDIYNPALGTFAPSGAPIDKRYESQIEFQWTKGTAIDLPVNTAGWAPIGWVYRAAGGGLITVNNAGTMSVQLEDIVPGTTPSNQVVRKRYTWKDTYGIGRAGAGSAWWDLAADVAGLRCYSQSGDDDWKTAAFIEATSIAPLNVQYTWGYVYLAPLPDAMPKKVGYVGLTSSAIVNGVMIISRTPPDQFGRNSIALTPPPPFSNYTVPIGGAAHVAVVRSNGAGLASIPTIQTADGRGRTAFRQFNSNNFPLTQGNAYIGPAGPAYNLATLGPGATEDVPWGVALECVLQHTDVPLRAAPPVAYAAEITMGMGVGGFSDNVGSPASFPRMMLSTTDLDVREFWLFPESADLTLNVSFVPRSNAMANSGGGAADCVGVAAEAGLIGWQF